MKIRLLDSKFYKWTLPILVLGLVGCDLKQAPKPPTFTNTIEFPLLRTSVNLDDLKDADNIREQLYINGSDTMMIYAYDDFSVMDSQEVGDQLAFGDIVKSFAQSVDDVTVTGSTINQSSAFAAVGVSPIQEIIQSEIGPIELGDIPTTATDPFQLNEIVPSVNDIPDGTTTTIPAGNLAPVKKPFTFTDFESADFSGGTLDITINNDMVIGLGSPIDIQLQAVGLNDTTDIAGGLLTFTSVITPGTSQTESLDLTGMTLPGNIMVEVTGSTIGSDGNAILIDAAAKLSAFDILIAGSNLQVSSATAKVPAQTIEESGAITMADSDNKIETARIGAGSLSIDIENSLDVASQLTIEIVSLQDESEVAFTTVVQIPANQTVVDVSDIAGYSLVMDINQQEVEYSYTVETIDTEDDYAVVTQTDQVNVTISLYGDTVGEDLFFNRITGIITPQNIEESGEIAISSESKLLLADISFGSLTIDIDNQVNEAGFAGLPTISLTIPELVDASSNPLTGTMTLDPSPLSNQLNFDLADYSLTFPDSANQVLTYTTVVTTPQGEIGRYGLEDSIIVDIVVADMEFASVTGYFTQDALVDSNEISLDEETKLLEAIFETGDFALSMTNRIGVVADVEFQIDEFLHRTTNQPLSMAFRLENIQTPQVNNLDLSEYKLAFESANPGESQGIHYVSRVSLPSDEEMTLTFGDSILIDVNISDLVMESVTGIIAPDTLVIEETEQTIDMPDQVSDLMFERVNIDIDFNSTFTIPIVLSLNLTGTDSLGNTEAINIIHNLTPENDVVHIDAASILNIHPESIIASGEAIIGDGVSSSTIAKGQGMRPIMYINVPLSLIIDDPDPIDDLEATEIESPLPDDNTVSLEEVTLYADVMNLFEFGASLVVLASNDSLTFDSTAIAMGFAPAADTLISLELTPYDPIQGPISILNEIILDSDKLQLFEEKMFLKPEVQLLGVKDEFGNSTPSRFYTTDSLTVNTWGRISYTIHGEEL